MDLNEAMQKAADEAVKKATADILTEAMKTFRSIDQALALIAKNMEAFAHPVLTIPAGAIPLADAKLDGAPVTSVAVEPNLTVTPVAAAPAPVKRGPGRPRKNPLPETAAAPTPVKPELKVVPPPQEQVEHAEQKPLPEYKAPAPCRGCGVDTNIEGIMHSKACDQVKGGGAAPEGGYLVKPEDVPALKQVVAAEEKAAEPKPAEQPSFEELREVAVAFAQKFTKPKLLEEMAAFMPPGTKDPKLTLITDRAGAVALLKKAMA